MAKLVLEISKPAVGDIVDRKITAAGIIRIELSGQFPTIKLEKLQVEFGSRGERKILDPPLGTSWQASGSVAPTAVGGRTLQITATASGTQTIKSGPPTDPEYRTKPFSQKASVTVTLRDDVLETL